MSTRAVPSTPMFTEVSHTVTQNPKNRGRYYALGLLIPDRVYASGSWTREGYTGHELDPETGDYYAGARYYLPELGRWISLDPLADKYPGYSPYNYVLGDPVGLFDSSGLCPDGVATGDAYTDSDGQTTYCLAEQDAVVVEAERSQSGLDTQIDFISELVDLYFGFSDTAESISHMGHNKRVIADVVNESRSVEAEEFLCAISELSYGIENTAGTVETLATAVALATALQTGGTGTAAFAPLAKGANLVGNTFGVISTIVEGTQAYLGYRPISDASFRAGGRLSGIVTGVRPLAGTFAQMGGRALSDQFETPCSRFYE